MITLGLDMALHTGFAIVNNGRLIESGVWDLSGVRKPAGKHNGHLFEKLRQAIGCCCAYNNVQRICYERAHFRGGAPTRIGVGLASVVLEFCAVSNVPVRDVATTTLKKWATGTGRADKRAMILAAARMTGQPFESDDEADAVLVALWGDEQARTGGWESAKPKR